MTEREQINALATKIEQVVARYSNEFNLTYASTIGVLHMAIAKLEKDAFEDDHDET